MPKRTTKVILSEKEQEGLEQLTKRHRSEQQRETIQNRVLAMPLYRFQWRVRSRGCQDTSCKKSDVTHHLIPESVLRGN
jgi:hypothetical protein